MKFEFLGAEVAKVIHLGNDLQVGGGCTLWGGWLLLMGCV